MTFAKGTYRSVYGEIKSEWEKKDGKMYFRCSIPANTTATIKLPVSKNAAIEVNGKKISEAKAVLNVLENEQKPSFVLGSGNYVIEAAL